MIHAPSGEHGPAIRHEHRVAMPLVFLFRATGDDDMPRGIRRDVHGRDGNRAQGFRRGSSKGRSFCCMDEGTARGRGKEEKKSEIHHNRKRGRRKPFAAHLSLKCVMVTPLLSGASGGRSPLE